MDGAAAVIPQIVITNEAPEAFGPDPRSLEQLRARAASLGRGEALPSTASRTSRERLALLSTAATADVKDLLECIGRHPLLSEAELALVLRLAPVSTSAAIQRSLRLGLVELAPTPRHGGPRFCLSATGLWLLAARDGVPVQRYAWTGHRIAATLPALGCERLRTLVKQFEHTTGVNSFFAHCLANHRRSSAPKLVRWLNLSESAIQFESDGRERWIRPDGTGELEYEGARYRFFLEWDCGTEHERALRRKLLCYASYYRGRPQAGVPVLHFVTPTWKRERFLWRAITALADRPGAIKLPIRTTAWTILEDVGAFGPAWRSVDLPGRGRWPVGPEVGPIG